MRIVEHTPERLRLEYHPRWQQWFFAIGAVLFVAMAWFARRDGLGLSAGLLLVAALLGLGLLLVMGRSTAEFSRATQRVTIAFRSPFQRTAQELRLSEIDQAIVQSFGPDTMTSKGGATTRRPALALRRRQQPSVPLTPVYRTGRSAARAVEAVNRWLEAARTPATRRG
jgi:hypothetical protein